MAIPSSDTFEYEAQFTPEGFGADDIVLHGTARHDENAVRLVGHKPMIRFYEERLIIAAADTDRSNALVRMVSCAFGDAVDVAAQPGDRLHVVRTATGDIGLSVLRDEKLRLAVGAVTAVPLGNELRAATKAVTSVLWAAPDAAFWLEVGLKDESLTLRERDEVEFGDYCIYVERTARSGEPGIAACAAICIASDAKLKTAAMRSAVLLANGGLRIVDWSGKWL